MIEDQSDGARPSWLGPDDKWVSPSSAGGGVIEVPDHGVDAELDEDDWVDESDPITVHPDECRPGEVEFSLEWTTGAPSSLEGTITALNISNRTWRLTGIPTFVFFGPDGSPLDEPDQFINTISSSRVSVQPGQTAACSVGWHWDGTPVSRKLGIRWEGGFETLVPAGPMHPEEVFGQMVTSASHFALHP